MIDLEGPQVPVVDPHQVGLQRRGADQLPRAGSRGKLCHPMFLLNPAAHSGVDTASHGQQRGPVAIAAKDIGQLG